MEKDLDKIIDNLKEICSIKKLNVSDDVLFTQACSFKRGELANQHKKSDPSQQKEDPPTGKQLALLKKHNYNGEIPKTKREARTLIKDYLESLKNP